MEESHTNLTAGVLSSGSSGVWLEECNCASPDRFCFGVEAGVAERCGRAWPVGFGALGLVITIFVVEVVGLVFLLCLLKEKQGLGSNHGLEAVRGTLILIKN